MNQLYYRTFIGLPLQVNDQFLKSREELISMLSGERISWVHPSRYHITLRFIGETGVSEIRRISGALKEAVEVPGKQYLRLDRLGSFGNRNQPRVLWVGFEDTQLFVAMKTMTDTALGICNIAPDEQPFSPHLTLGRIRNRVNLPVFNPSIESMKERFREEVFVDRLVFYRSEPGPKGPVYTPLSTLMFGDQDL
jgi:2'-5' RNA ligase